MSSTILVPVSAMKPELDTALCLSSVCVRVSASFSTNPKGGGSGDDPAFQKSRLWREERERIANLGRINKVMEKKFPRLEKRLQLRSAEMMKDVTVTLEALCMKAMEFQGEQEKNDESLVMSLSDLLSESYEKLLKAEFDFVKAKGVYMVGTLLSSLISKRLKTVKSITSIYGELGFNTFNTFEDAVKASTSFSLFQKEVKLDEGKVEHCYVLVVNGYKGWIVKAKREDLCPPFQFLK
ncbi:unnamed protein product [Arabidopsis arenosa]|uniref:Uncharacterized protein n=1 Tax=Arabidopsis arenosa TaxID=38785 RepID=A0A8S2AL16_ARAAE|nr:unnamed protein product [Arabidopsis arenosa]